MDRTCMASAGVSGASEDNAKQVSCGPARDKHYSPARGPVLIREPPRLCPCSSCGHGSPEAEPSWRSSTIPLVCTVLLAVYALLGTGEKTKPLKLKPLKFQIKSYHVIIMIILVSLPLVTAPPVTRGSGGGSSSSTTPSVNDIIPNTQRDYDFLPGMKRWNGIPFTDFTRIWLAALIIALGTISMDGITLLTTAEGNDPHATSADATEQAKFAQRSTRVFCCIMNYIKTNSRCARIANHPTHGFKNDKTF